jgi:hypothetical protein
MGLHMVLL